MPGTDAPAHRSLFWIVLVALAVRLLAMAFLYGDLLEPIEDHFPFAWETGRVARSIASGHGFGSPFNGDTGPTAVLPPVYPYLLAGIFKLFGIYTKASALAILTLQGLFSSLTCVTIFFVALRNFGPATARAAAWLWAFFPYAIYISSHDVWESALTPLLASSLFLLALKLAGSPNWKLWLAFGLLWGLVALTSPAMLSILPVMGGWAAFRLRARGMRWAGGAAMAALLFALCVAPWVLRNYSTFGRFIPLRDNFGLELYVGNSLETDEPWHAWMHPAHSQAEMQEMERLGETSYLAEKRREAIEFIAAHPGVFAWLTCKRILYVWTGIWNLHASYLLANLGEALNIPFCSLISLLAFLGLRRAFQKNPAIAWLYFLALFAGPLAYYFTHVEIPYRHPLDPFLVILLAYASVEFSSRRSASTPALRSRSPA